MKRLAQFFLLSNMMLPEIVNAVLTAIWGVWVGNVFWDVFPIADLYSAFTIMPEWAWGIVAVLLGGIQLMSIANNHWRLRRAASMGMVIFWLFVSVAFILSDWRSTATVIYPFIVMFSIRSYLRLQLVNPADWSEQHRYE